MQSAQQIKINFNDYLKQQQYTAIAESSLIPPNDDKSILFTNSGMVQFKPIFLGNAKPSNDNIYNIQKCIRAGGKHNDYDEVGKDTYHHTMFSMMGYWKFNCLDDNYKTEAIYNSWYLLVNIYSLDPKRLYATYFAGDDEIPEDLVARNEWMKYLPQKQILPFGRKENFWMMASHGPCGPCSEIHYDLVGDRDASKYVNTDDPTVIELWNNVFMQYNMQDDGVLTELKYKHLDVGAGFERIVMAVQNKSSSYDTDVFQPLFDKIFELSKIKCTEDTIIAYRIIADHLRTFIFAVSQDIIPSAHDRGFILTKLFNRMTLYAYQYLKVNYGFINKLAEEVIDLLIIDDVQLKTNKNLILYVIKNEEARCGKIIWKSVLIFNKILNKESKTITQDEILLIKSRGVPIDLIDQFIIDNKLIKQ